MELCDFFLTHAQEVYKCDRVVVCWCCGSWMIYRVMLLIQYPPIALHSHVSPLNPSTSFRSLVQKLFHWWRICVGFRPNYIHPLNTTTNYVTTTLGCEKNGSMGRLENSFSYIYTFQVLDSMWERNLWPWNPSPLLSSCMKL